MTDIEQARAELVATLAARSWQKLKPDLDSVIKAMFHVAERMAETFPLIAKAFDKALTPIIQTAIKGLAPLGRLLEAKGYLPSDGDVEQS